MIEDSVMPQRFGGPGFELVSVGEMVGKLNAALSARDDPSLVIAARIAALKVEGAKRAAERARAYTETGVDALFITGLKTLEEFDTIREAVKVPIIMGTAPGIKREEFAKRGVRFLLQGHQPVAVAAKALQQAYAHLYKGGAPSELAPMMAAPADMEKFLNVPRYEEWQRKYLA
jgi:carboxyvinyl-carboxyphosphonate phosphorylmutase